MTTEPELDSSRWDRDRRGSKEAPPFPRDAVKSHVFQTLGWAGVKARMGWRAHRVSVDRDGFRAGLQVLERDFPKIGYRFFYAPRGPVIGDGCRPEDLDRLFSLAQQLATERRAVFLKIDPDVPTRGLGWPLDPRGAFPGLVPPLAENPPDGVKEPAFQDWITPHLVRNGFRPAPASGGFSGVQPRRVFRLDISRSEEELLRGMDQKTRYNIRLAEKKGVAVRPVDAQDDIDAFYRILVETARRDGFLIRPAKYFHDIRECLGNQARFFLAEREGRAIAGALALTAGPMAWYAYGASANMDRDCMPNHLMQWTLIRWAKAQGCSLYDFRAVPSDPTPDNPLYGLYRFKKGFGGVLTEFVGEFDRVYVPWLYALWVHGWPLFKKVRRALLLRAPAGRPED